MEITYGSQIIGSGAESQSKPVAWHMGLKVQIVRQTCAQPCLSPEALASESHNWLSEALQIPEIPIAQGSEID
jgi:hypothetical protein